MKCPNCNKKLRWLPKGKHTCLCGEVIETDGKDLQDVEIALINIPAREERSNDVEILIGLAVIFVLSMLGLRIFFHDAILHIEAGLIQTVFGIDPADYKQAVAPYIAAAALILWLTVKAVKKIRKKV